jgi:predicted membrane channel-forming protein YqfA (hemolysin III family)
MAKNQRNQSSLQAFASDPFFFDKPTWPHGLVIGGVTLGLALLLVTTVAHVSPQQPVMFMLFSLSAFLVVAGVVFLASRYPPPAH